MSRMKFMNTEIDNLTMEETLQAVDQLIQEDKSSYVVTPNVDHIVQLETSKELQAVYDNASLILTDGKPLLWIAKWYGTPIKEKISGSDEENLISRLTLRSMKKAKYTPECVGHFGLAARYYCHFTSPIRRYPDLQIHRIIKECLHGGMSEKRKEHYDKILPDVAEQTSATERRADEAERDTDKLKMVEYMEQFKGEKFSRVISGVTNWGIYVELPNTIEGMVSVNDMPGFYIFDENHYEMINETTHKTYKLGQKVDVVTIGTNKIARTIDFMFAEDYDSRYN